MPHANNYSFKHRGKFRSADEIADMRDAERAEVEMPHINLKFLPCVEELNELEDGEIIEYFFICESKIPVVVEGVEVSKKRCGRKFATEDPDAVCPYCNGEDARIIPRSFLRLYGMKKEVRFYVTDEMKPRKGLAAKYLEVAKQIIEKYGQAGPAEIKETKEVKEGQG